MITYNPRDWYSFIFRLHRSDTVRQLAWSMVGIAVYSAAVAFLEKEIWRLTDTSPVKNLTVIHSLLGFVLSLLLVFRTNTAYDRWWEGRKLWGSLVNNSRNLAIQLHVILPPEDNTSRHHFARLISLYAKVLSVHLRSEKTRLELDEQDHPELRELDLQKHVPNQVASLISQRVYRLANEGKIKPEYLINLNQQLLVFTDVCGACERIKNTPIPISYSTFVKKFIFFYVMTLPFGFVFSISYFVIPVAVFIFYALASLEIIAEEIEDPFGGDSNDLPTEKIASNIRIHTEEVLLGSAHRK